jgi:hypothetical protein
MCSTIGQRARWMLLTCGIAMTLWTCDRDSAPTAPTPPTPAAGAQTDTGRPFYYYEGERIFLREDGRRIVVSQLGPGRVPTPRAEIATRARAALMAAGMSVDSVHVIASEPDHSILTLSGAIAPAATDEAVARLRSTRQFAFVAPAYTTVVGGDEVLMLNRIAVHFKSGVTRAQVDSLNQALGTWIIAPPRPDSGRAEYWLGYPPDSSAPWRVAALVAQHPLVAWADPDKISNRRAWYTPSDPYFPLQWNLTNPTDTLNGVPVDIDAERAWGITRGSASVHVAIIDDGVDFTQQDLGAGSNAFAGAMGFDELYQPGQTDDVLHPFGNDTHGTSIAGIIAAGQDNGMGIAGIAPNVVLNIVRIIRHTYPLYPGEQPTPDVASDAKIADGINWAWNVAHSDILSNSWGGGAPSTAITNAINSAATNGRGGKGSLVVFSAGNTSQRQFGVIGSVTYPATLSSVIAVSAIDRTGAPADYAPQGWSMLIVAPSGHLTGLCLGELTTLDRWGSAGCNDGPGGDASYTTSFSGTSAAAP